MVSEKYDYGTAKKLAGELFVEIQKISDFHKYDLFDFPEEDEEFEGVIIDFKYSLEQTYQALDELTSQINYIEKQSQDSDDSINGE